MRILIVHNSYQQPGGEDIVFEQERQLLALAGHDVFTYERTNWEVAEYSGLRRIELLTKTIWAADTKQKFARLLVEYKPDLVHAHNTFIMVSPAIFSACSEADVPVVQTLHNFRLCCPAS